MGRRKSIESIGEYYKRPHYSYVIRILAFEEKIPSKTIYARIHAFEKENALYNQFKDIIKVDVERFERIRCNEIKVGEEDISLQLNSQDEWQVFPLTDRSLMSFVQTKITNNPYGMFYDDVHGSPLLKINPITSKRLSQILGDLVELDLIVKNDKQYQIPEKFTFEIQRIQMIQSLDEAYNGAIDPKLGVYILYNHPSDYIGKCLKKNMESISEDLKSTLKNATKLMIRARLEEIEKSMRKYLENEELSLNKKAYILYYIRQQVDNGLESFIHSIMEPFELIEPTIDEKHHKKSRYFEKNLNEYKTVFKDLLDKIQTPRFPENYEFYTQLLETVKQFDDGEISIGSGWEKKVMFKLFPQKMFIFDFKPIIVAR